MGTATSTAGLGSPPVAPAVVALCPLSAADLFQHHDCRRAHGDQLPAPPAGVLAGRRHALSIPHRLDRATSRKPAARPSILAHADVHPLRPRDGTLPLCPPLRRLRHAAILRALPQPDRNLRSFHSHQESDPLARRSVRHRNRGANRGIYSRLRSLARRHLTVAPNRRLLVTRNSARLSASLLSRRTPAARRSAL